jgi:hypothetical protein
MLEFYQTRAGRKFFESDLPRIIESLEDIAKELKKSNNRNTCQKCGAQVKNGHTHCDMCIDLL